MKSKIAEQIASLLNKHNQLVINYDEQKVLSNQNNIIFEQNEDDEVLACIECKKVQWYQYEVCHLTVNPKYRRNGYGIKILNKAVEHARNNRGRIVQCTIREGNEASEELFRKAGFEKVSCFHYPDSGNNNGVWQIVICPANKQ